jgi:putative endonuclease
LSPRPAAPASRRAGEENSANRIDGSACRVSRFPGAAQHALFARDALQTRDQSPGSAAHRYAQERCALRRIRESAIGYAAHSESRLPDRYFVYVLANRRNGTLYVGVTNDLRRRIAEHKKKYVPGFTRQYGVDQLMYAEEYASILEARARERSLKRWRRAWKVALIEKRNPEWRDLSAEYALE